MTRKVVVCRPMTVAVGVDPGSSQGAIAVVVTDEGGRPRVAMLEEWRKDKRKRPRGRFRLWQGGDLGEWSEREEPVAHPDRVVFRVGKRAKHLAMDEGLDLRAGVEDIQIYGPPRAGLMGLASSAGGHEALLRMVLECHVVRPRERQWVKQTADVPGRARKAMTRKFLTSAYLGEACIGPTFVVDWRCRLQGATPTEHAVDAIGVALFAAGAQLVTPQERENNDKATED